MWRSREEQALADREAGGAAPGTTAAASSDARHVRRGDPGPELEARAAAQASSAANAPSGRPFVKGSCTALLARLGREAEGRAHPCRRALVRKSHGERAQQVRGLLVVVEDLAAALPWWTRASGPARSARPPGRRSGWVGRGQGQAGQRAQDQQGPRPARAPAQQTHPLDGKRSPRNRRAASSGGRLAP